MNHREQAAELMIRIISDIDPSSPAQQFVRTGKGLAYLRNLGKALPYRFSELSRWLAEECPRCGWKTARCDSNEEGRHAVMSVYVIVSCAGLPVINPNAVGVPSPGWVDWTEKAKREEAKR